jgi:hypothetical protein
MSNKQVPFWDIFNAGISVEGHKTSKKCTICEDDNCDDLKCEYFHEGRDCIITIWKSGIIKDGDMMDEILLEDLKSYYMTEPLKKFLQKELRRRIPLDETFRDLLKEIYKKTNEERKLNFQYETLKENVIRLQTTLNNLEEKNVTLKTLLSCEKENFRNLELQESYKRNQLNELILSNKQLTTKIEELADEYGKQIEIRERMERSNINKEELLKMEEELKVSEEENKLLLEQLLKYPTVDLGELRERINVEEKRFELGKVELAWITSLNIKMEKNVKMERKCTSALLLQKSEINRKKASLSDKVPEIKNNQCCVCFDELITCVFSPCQHACCCNTCGEILDKCPLCREEIDVKSAIYL